ncbi:ribonuclease 2-like [Amaranthus tricolor]|uniref:ribonuclease 2-like n=1 Tax=Amaranthus tricolor TaxID=29722 RepID=UPI00258BFCCB|nr:ribonuclease 2-like [Amaranthus tricolor]
MAFFPIAILSNILIISLLASSVSFNGVDGGLLSRKYREFDYFVLALQWPGTYCRNTHKCCQKNGCCRSNGPPKHFTIQFSHHLMGIAELVKNCGTELFLFTREYISTLRNALDEYWPSLSCGSPSTCHGHKGSFWAHEWGKYLWLSSIFKLLSFKKNLNF